MQASYAFSSKLPNRIDRAVLDESFQNTRMAGEAIHMVIGKVEDEDLALDLNRQACRFLQFEEKLQQMYAREHETPPRDLQSRHQPSDLILIAARPSMGKTAFVLNLAQHMAFKKDVPVAIFSLEMSKEQLVNRMLSLESHVDAQKIRTGRLNDEEWMNLVEGSANIANSKLFIDDTPGITLSAMRSKCRKLKMEHDIQIVIIDYLQLMSGNSGNNASRQQEISDISRGLKDLARELNVPVIALSQLSRAVEQRPDHRPMLSDLRESGAIEQDADVVMFLYREGYYNRDLSEAEQRVAEVIIAKQRNGPIGTVNLLWIPELTKFTDMDREPV